MAMTLQHGEGALQGNPSDTSGKPVLFDKLFGYFPWFGNNGNNRNFEDNPWSEWSMCRHDVQTRKRTCDADQQSSANCFQARYCQPKMSWATWDSWSACDNQNGQIVRKRSRECLDTVGVTLYGVVRCPGSSTQSELCNNGVDPENSFSEWSDWSECDYNIGYQRSQRTCYGSECQGPVQVRLRRCQEDRSSNFGMWGEWTEWSACMGNSRERKRMCYYNVCPGLGIETEDCVVDDRTFPDSDWSAWAVWSQCNGRIQTRNRRCLLQSCHGFDSESRLCSLSDRTGVNDTTSNPTSQWSSWGVWSQCNNGAQARVRSCQGNSNCPGVAYQTRTCAVQATVKPTVSQLGWMEWSVCGNDRTQVRSRQCPFTISPCPVETSDTRVCTGDRTVQVNQQKGDWAGWSHGNDRTGSDNTTPNPTSQWSSWAGWSQCNNGAQARVRSCQGNSNCPGVAYQTRTCAVQTTVTPTVSQLGWTEWSVCGNDRTQVRSRQCPYALSSCPVKTWDTRVCTGDRTVQIDQQKGNGAGWSSWSGWSSGTGRSSDNGRSAWSMWSAWTGCNDGLARRTRSCRMSIECTGHSTETKTCLVHNSPKTGPSSYVLPGWSDWGSWNRDCENGKRWRYRTCQTDPEDIGNCVGPSSDSVLCNT